MKVPPTSTPTILPTTAFMRPLLSQRDSGALIHLTIVLDHDAVIAGRRLGIDVAQSNVAGDTLRISPHGIAPATAAGRFQAYTLTGADLHVCDLGRHRRGTLPSSVCQKKRFRAAGMPPATPNGANLPRSPRRNIGIGQRLDLVDGPDAAAMRAGSSGIRPQRPLGEHHRIGCLEDLSGGIVAVDIGLLAWLSPSLSGFPPRPPPKNENITQREPSCAMAGETRR